MPPIAVRRVSDVVPRGDVQETVMESATPLKMLRESIFNPLKSGFGLSLLPTSRAALQTAAFRTVPKESQLSSAQAARRAKLYQQYEEDRPAFEADATIYHLLDNGAEDAEVRMVPIIEGPSQADGTALSQSPAVSLLPELAQQAARPSTSTDWEGEVTHTQVRASCEECERAVPTMRCQACEESVCERCLAILHPPTSMGEPHEHYTEQHIRPLQPGDSAGHVSILLPHIHDGPVPEADWGHVRDLREPWSFESMAPNDLRGRPPTLETEGARFTAGDVVVWSLLPNDEVDPDPDSQQLAAGTRVPWRDVEAFGRVLSSTCNGSGPHVPASLRTDLHELCYLLEFLGYVQGDYKLLIKHERPPPFRVPVLRASDASDVECLAQRHAFQLDLRLRAHRDDQIELSNATQGLLQRTGDHRVVLLPQRRLADPNEKQAALRARRHKLLTPLLARYVQRVLDQILGPRFGHLRHVYESHRDMTRFAYAVSIQKYARRYLHRLTLEVKRGEREAEQYRRGRELHATFKYVKDPEQQRVARTVNAQDFFATMCELRRWFRHRQVVASRVLLKHLRRKAMGSCGKALNQWKAWFDSLDPCHIEGDPSDLAADVLARQVPPSFHPAHGLSKLLPPLPSMHARRQTDGSLLVENPTKFNSFMAGCAGPSDRSAWVIDGLLLLGVTPSVVVPKLGSRSEVEDLVMQGVGTFVCLLTPHELDHAVAQAELSKPLESELGFVHKSVLGMAQTEALDAEQSYKSHEEELKKLRERYKRQPRNKVVRDMEDRTRLARKAWEESRVRMNRVQRVFHWVHWPLPKDDAPPLATLLPLVEQIERRIRGGERVYVFSTEGHGRAGMVTACVLGRLYSLPVEETLERIQLIHDSAKGLGRMKDGSLLKPAQGRSCPYTAQQSHMVRQVVLYRATEYEPIITVTGPPLDARRERLIRSRRLRMGYPDISSEGQVIKEDEMPGPAAAMDADMTQTLSTSGLMRTRQDSMSGDEGEVEETYNIYVGY